MDKQEREKIILSTSVVLGKAVIAFKNKKSPGGDEYARRALVALAFLRAGNIVGTRRWARLLVVEN